MEPFKNKYCENTLKPFALSIKKAYPKFKSKNFITESTKIISPLEMKDRVRAIAENLYKHLPKNYNTAVDILISSLAESVDDESATWEVESKSGISGFMVWPLTQYVELYGIDHYEKSLEALHAMTQRFSSEFAVRPFIERYDKDFFKVLKIWKKDESHHVRRLVSEGTRPRLPWGIKVLAIHNNLERNTKLIFSLRKDSSLYVRRSVANHLNDISYLDEDLFFKTLDKMGNSKEEVWIKRHATRSLLKKGNSRALQMHGYDPKLKLKTNLSLSSNKIIEGESFELSLDLEKKTTKESNILVEYIIHYPKKNGSYSPKVFRLKDTKIGKSLSLVKKIHFKKVTTRTHYPGIHFLEIQINGRQYQRLSFELEVR